MACCSPVDKTMLPLPLHTTDCPRINMMIRIHPWEICSHDIRETINGFVLVKLFFSNVVVCLRNHTKSHFNMSKFAILKSVGVLYRCPSSPLWSKNNLNGVIHLLYSLSLNKVPCRTTLMMEVRGTTGAVYILSNWCPSQLLICVPVLPPLSLVY